MKKSTLGLTVLLILAILAGAGTIYYIFFVSDEIKEKISTTIQNNIGADKGSTKIASAQSKNMTYYVTDAKIAVHDLPNANSAIIETLYKGEKLKGFEQKQITINNELETWLRISEYVIYKEGEQESATWVNIKGVSNTEPVIAEQEKLEMLNSYLKSSDDLDMYRDIFFRVTQQLLDNGMCSPIDFNEIGGWVRSVTYNQDKVYFIYCGGIEQQDKIYLNVITGQTFTH